KGRFGLTLSPLSLPMSLFFLWAAASLVKSQDPYQGGLLLFRLALLILFFHFLLDAFTSDLPIDFAIHVILLTSLLISVYGLLQGGGIDFLRLERRFEPVSTLGNTGYVAEFLILVLPLSLTRFLAAPSPLGRLLYFLSTLLLLSLLFRTSCRGGWVAALGSFLLMAAALAMKLRSKSALPSFRLRPLAPFLLVGLLLLGFLILYQPQSLLQGAARLQSIFDLQFPTNRVRILIWKGTLQLVSQHPWLGVGLGNFEFAFPRFRSLEEWLISERLPLAEAHNDYLHMAAELGIPGLLLFLWLLFTLFAMSIRILRSSASPASYLRSLAITAGLVGLFIYAFFGFPLRNPVPSLYFFSFMAYLSAQDQLSRKDRLRRRKEISYVVVWPIAILLLFLSYPFTLQWFLADLHLKRAQVALAQGDREMALAQYGKAVFHYFPLHHQQQLRSFTLDEDRLYRQLIERYRIALLSQPRNARLHMQLGTALMEAGRLEEALSQMQTALSLDEGLGEARERMGLIFLQQGRLQQAAAQFRILTQRDPESGRAHFFLGVALYRQGLLSEARGEWEAAYRLDPSLSGAQHLLEKTGKERK
ncbi:MAG: O-antigen ligase family protein, partial [candidate division NC10 bacterium]|nr:O-antigen ligase family protein [candidate division NC10 bacterium]